jgi:omega-amidase
MTQTNWNIALLQMDIAIGEPDRNYEKLQALLARLIDEGTKPDVVMFPEMWNTGYALDRIHDLADVDAERTHALLSSFSRQHKLNIIGGSIAEKRGSDIFNTIYAYNREGDRTADYSKIHLFRLMDEDKYLQEGSSIGQFEIDGIASGMMICYDIRFPELARKLALGGARILFVPAEWPNPRLHHWRTLLMARAIENQMYVVSCNRVGTSGTTEFFGHSMVIDPWGEVLAEGDQSEQIIRVQIDLELVGQVRSRIPIFEDRRPALY